MSAWAIKIFTDNFSTLPVMQQLFPLCENKKKNLKNCLVNLICYVSAATFKKINLNENQILFQIISIKHVCLIYFNVNFEGG